MIIDATASSAPLTLPDEILLSDQSDRLRWVNGLSAEWFTTEMTDGVSGETSIGEIG